jgi:hypothetical protein
VPTRDFGELAGGELGIEINRITLWAHRIGFVAFGLDGTDPRCSQPAHDCGRAGGQQWPKLGASETDPNRGHFGPKSHYE